jgi:hypothetical protein
VRAAQVELVISPESDLPHPEKSRKTVMCVMGSTIYWRFADERQLLEAMVEEMLQKEFADPIRCSGGSTEANVCGFKIRLCL